MLWLLLLLMMMMMLWLLLLLMMMMMLWLLLGICLLILRVSLLLLGVCLLVWAHMLDILLLRAPPSLTVVQRLRIHGRLALLVVWCRARLLLLCLHHDAGASPGRDDANLSFGRG